MFNIKVPFLVASHGLKRAGTSWATSKSKASAFAFNTSDSNKFWWLEGSTVRKGVSEDGAQTLTNKTLTSPVITGALGGVVALETLFTQTAANAVHTAAFTIPAGATIIDIFVTNVALWTSDTSATLKVGLVDDDCFFTAVDLKTVPGAGKSMNWAWPGASNAGASIPEIDGGAGNTQLGATNGLLYLATAQTVNAIVTDVNVAGVAGRTRVTVLYSLPSSVIAPVVV